MQKGQTQVLILAGIVILVAVFGGIFYLGRATAPKPQPQTPVVTPQPSPTPDETVYTEQSRSANWKTYTNEKYSFSFNYSKDITLNVENDNESQFLLTLKNANEELAIEVSPATYGSFFLRGNPTISKVTVNNITWTIVPESEYCDAGSCGKVSQAYIIKHNNWYYNLILREISSASITLNQILSTFRFLP